MTTVADDSAYPIAPAGAGRVMPSMGLTKREQFAIIAAEGILAGTSSFVSNWTGPTPAQVAARSIEVADALIAELNA